MPESVKEELMLPRGWDPAGTTAIVRKCVRPSPASEASDFSQFCNFPPTFRLLWVSIASYRKVTIILVG